MDGLTIAIPTWNHEFFLPRSILSALEVVRELRSFDVPAEVLVIDDGSRDGSSGLLRNLEARYAGKGLRVRQHLTNSGPAETRNSALRHSQYASIVFLDADNELFPQNMPTLYRALRETGAASVYGNLFKCRQGSSKAFQLLSNESIQSRLFDQNYIDTCALFDRAQLLDLNGYCSQYWEDWEMWMHLATNGRRIIFIPLSIGCYYELPNSMVQAHSDTQWNAQWDRSQRIYKQVGFRKFLATRTEQLSYLPGVGYL